MLVRRPLLGKARSMPTNPAGGLDARRQTCQIIDSTPASVMPRPQTPPPLSRRERQIMDVVYGLGHATAADVHARLEDPPTYTTVRGLLRILIQKGHLGSHLEGRRY